VINLPSKPKYGSPCNGCGICCAKELCVVGELAFPGASAPCPALKITSDGSRTYCELIAAETVFNLNPLLKQALGIGTGCSMKDE
jgi:uncharacterized cysteine cluster protein YcgN (CxxCxxCC family)